MHSSQRAHPSHCHSIYVLLTLRHFAFCPSASLFDGISVSISVQARFSAARFLLQTFDPWPLTTPSAHCGLDIEFLKSCALHWRFFAAIVSLSFRACSSVSVSLGSFSFPQFSLISFPAFCFVYVISCSFPLPVFVVCYSFNLLILTYCAFPLFV